MTLSSKGMGPDLMQMGGPMECAAEYCLRLVLTLLKQDLMRVQRRHVGRSRW